MYQKKRDGIPDANNQNSAQGDTRSRVLPEQERIDNAFLPRLLEEMNETRDEILIRGLEIWCHVGVPNEELALPQRLLVDVSIHPEERFEHMADNISVTVDYDAVCKRLVALAASRNRRLIESLASDMANTVLAEFPATSVTIEIQKFILKNTESVGVRCTRSRDV